MAKLFWKTVMLLSLFFSRTVNNLKITEYTDNNSNSKNITNPIIKII